MVVVVSSSCFFLVIKYDLFCKLADSKTGSNLIFIYISNTKQFSVITLDVKKKM